MICTADWQAEWSNLDLCQQAWEEVLHICDKYHLKIIVMCGDGKEAYDPVSIRVVKFWHRSIRQARKLRIRVLYLLGNHDRIGQYSESGNWLSVLKHAGAETFDEPAIVDAGDRRLFMLPFASVPQIKAWAQHLVKTGKPDKTKDVLFFHANLLEARYSRHGKQSDSALGVYDLRHDHFRLCIGGDIHFPQILGREKSVYYTGSPFAHSWGEVNIRHRYLVVVGRSIVSVHSNIPGWHDPDVPGFEKSMPRTWRGSRIRISVSCDASEDYERRLEKARRAAEKKYRGATIYVVPKFSDERREVSGISTEETDERKLKEYIKQNTAPPMALEYMLDKLSHFSHGLRTGTRFKLLWAKARNYLSFEKLYFDFRQEGIIVVKGVNQDRGNKSNGAGKTSVTNLIPVAWFGRTFKGQSHDRWSNRFHSKDQATVEVCGRDVKQRVVQVIRGRRPTMLKLLVDGKNESSGMKSTDTTGTQSQIEQVTGFTWPTLANAVYIDRTVSDAFLSGTKAQRTEVLSRFQNLERFEKALKLVKQDCKSSDEKYHVVLQELEGIRGRISECAKGLQHLKTLRNVQVRGAKLEFRRYRRRYRKLVHKNRSARRVLEKKASYLEKKHSHYLEDCTRDEKQVAMLEQAWRSAKAWAERWVNLKDKKECPTCFQPIKRSHLRRNKKKVIDLLKAAEHRLSKHEKSLTKVRLRVQITDGKFCEVQSRLSRLDQMENHLQAAMQTIRRQCEDLTSRQHTAYTIIGKTKEKLEALGVKKIRLKHRREQLRRKRVLYEYASQAFSRDGIPAFLNRQLCPILNKASDYYANLFSDGEIQVRFKVKGGEFVPQIINAKGGEGIKDQSEGERALAGLISSFALREAAPATPLLILDEPGSGLDEQTAKQFARSLKELNSKFRTIIITTHNPVISAELAGEKTITVYKKNGISRIKEAA